MHPHEALIHRFYDAFAARDADTMAACYHERAVFGDPVFPRLVGREIGMMWRMLCERASDLEIEHSRVAADDDRGTAHWDARYTFSGTGRKVINRIDASFRFEGGAIIEHNDVFDFWAWSRMAIGPAGVLLGWTPLLRNKVRAQAQRGLERFMERAP